MKAIPFYINEDRQRVACSPEEGAFLFIKLPCSFGGERSIPYLLKGTRKGTGRWTWNGNADKPTLAPSIAAYCVDGAKCERGDFGKCHSWVTDGVVRFFPDSTHLHDAEFMDLLDVTEDML